MWTISFVSLSRKQPCSHRALYSIIESTSITSSTSTFLHALSAVCVRIYIYIYIYTRIVFRLDASTDGRAPSSRPSSVVVAYYYTIMNIIISLLPFNFPRFLFELFRFDDASFLRVSSHHRFSHHVERHVFSLVVVQRGVVVSRRVVSKNHYS